MAILKIRDKEGKMVPVSAIVGPPGEKGPKGDKGDTGEPGVSGVYVGSGDMPDDCYIQIDPTGEGRSDIILSPSTAQVGQTIVVKEVDENGKPIEWECVDMSSGSGESIVLSEMSQLQLLIDTDMLPTIHNSEGKILTDINGKIILRY